MDRVSIRNLTFRLLLHKTCRQHVLRWTAAHEAKRPILIKINGRAIYTPQGTSNVHRYKSHNLNFKCTGSRLMAENEKEYLYKQQAGGCRCWWISKVHLIWTLTVRSHILNLCCQNHVRRYRWRIMKAAPWAQWKIVTYYYRMYFSISSN